MSEAAFWLRFPDEAVGCPACASSRIHPVDLLRGPRDQHRAVVFLFGCRACGLLFANPLPTSERLEQMYGDEGSWAAERADRMLRLKKGYRHRQRKGLPPKPRMTQRGPDILLEALQPYVPVHNPPEGARVLDFGCGEGKFLDRLQERGWNTFGIEPSTKVAFLRHHRLKEPTRDQSFHFVILHHVLEHMRAPLDTLRQLAESMVEDGMMFLSTPRIDTLPQHRDFPYCVDAHRHIVSFTERCLTGLLARAGLAVVATLNAPELDSRVTQGQPLRLRLVAVRTSRIDSLPADPLGPGLAALRAYHKVAADVSPRLLRALPVRLRAALVSRARVSAPHIDG